MSRYAARIEVPWSDPLDHPHIYIVNKDEHAILMADGTWRKYVEGTPLPIEDTPVLPREAIEALADAIDTFFGERSHYKTEVRILREWLVQESKRVDKAIVRGYGLE